MTKKIDVLELTRELIRLDTVSPPGSEEHCAHLLAGILKDAGFDVRFHEFAPGRPNLIARLVMGSGGMPLCLSGHMDTVPLGAVAWSRDPYGGETDSGRIYGRGSSDMKSGIAAIVAAAVNSALQNRGNGELLLIFTSAEESGNLGARGLANARDLLPPAGMMIVAEPTSNYPLIGHKGALWLSATTRGVTAHGSMPEKGVNAIHKAAEAVMKLKDFDFGIKPHPVLGGPTLNVGTISGGININSVPDQARIGIDIRTVPGLDHDGLIDSLTRHLGPEVELKRMIDARWVYSDPEDPRIGEVFTIAGGILGAEIVPRSVSYFTDGPVLASFLGDPVTLILGPGEPELAHQTDEFCFVERIEQAVLIYEQIIRKWWGH
ncbi:MAG: M20 family metallopeptidase [Syntrophobacter sp.]